MVKQRVVSRNQERSAQDPNENAIVISPSQLGKAEHVSRLLACVDAFSAWGTRPHIEHASSRRRAEQCNGYTGASRMLGWCVMPLHHVPLMKVSHEQN